VVVQAPAGTTLRDTITRVTVGDVVAQAAKLGRLHPERPAETPELLRL
jgi:hypothetical protein